MRKSLVMGFSIREYQALKLKIDNNGHFRVDTVIWSD
jgi:hypothetical protein